MLLHLRQNLPFNLEKGSYLFPGANHDLRFGGADPQSPVQVLARRSREQRRNPVVAKPHPLWPLLQLEILSIKIRNRTGTKGKPCQSPTCTRNRSDYGYVNQATAETRKHQAKSPEPHTPRKPATGSHRKHSGMPSPSPQNTLVFDWLGKLP